VSTTIHAGTGNWKPNESPEECPNGCGNLWKVSHEQSANHLLERTEKAKQQLAECKDNNFILGEQVIELRDALEFYGDKNNWDDGCFVSEGCFVTLEDGETAREALWALVMAFKI